jgi:hypothetical protein
MPGIATIALITFIFGWSEVIRAWPRTLERLAGRAELLGGFHNAGGEAGFG